MNEATGKEPDPTDFAVWTRNLQKTYMMGTQAIAALRGIDLSIRHREFTAIMGPSGCGKTTLLNLIGLLDVPTGGHLYIGGIETARMSPNHLADTRCKTLGYVFQFYNLLPMLTAIENVELPLNLSGMKRKERRTRAMELLKRVELSDRAHHLPSELSGGQQQRVTLARALSNRPAIVLLDEPTGDLDQVTSKEIMHIIEGLNRDDGVTFLMVTHDRGVAERSGRILNMVDGKIVREEIMPGSDIPIPSPNVPIQIISPSSTDMT